MEPVYLEFTDNTPRLKLKFQHKSLRAVVENTKKSIGELLADPFGGWPYLIQAACKLQQPRMTVDDASDVIDKLVDQGLTMNDISDKLGLALEAANYVKFDKSDADPNAQSPSAPV